MLHYQEFTPVEPVETTERANAVQSAEVATFNKKTLRFDDPVVEDRFLTSRQPIITQAVRYILWFAAAVIFCGSAIDFTELDLFHAEEMTLDRIVVAGGMLTAASIIRSAWAQRRFFAFLAVGAIASNLLWLVAAYQIGEDIQHYVGVLPINMLLTFLATGLMFRRATLIAIGAVLLYTPILYWLTPDPIPAIVYLIIGGLFAGYAAYMAERARREAWARGEALAREKRRADGLLLNVLPASIADRLKGGEALIADRYDDAAVLFADLVGFTAMSASMPPEQLVRILDEIFRSFDAIADQHDLEKIKTIGDCYMMASGLPRERRSDHARIAVAALEMQTTLRAIAARHGRSLDIRIGIHQGPVVAGVIGQSKFIFDLWGDTVNIASRLESTAPERSIQISAALRHSLDDTFIVEDRGEVELKGKGPFPAYLLHGVNAPRIS